MPPLLWILEWSINPELTPLSWANSNHTKPYHHEEVIGIFLITFWGTKVIKLKRNVISIIILVLNPKDSFQTFSLLCRIWSCSSSLLVVLTSLCFIDYSHLINLHAFHRLLSSTQPLNVGASLLIFSFLFLHTVPKSSLPLYWLELPPLCWWVPEGYL